MEPACSGLFVASSWLTLQPLSPKLARARGPEQEGPHSFPLSPCCSCTAAGGLPGAGDK